MKKATLLIAALALVLGLSQCRKPNVPTINGIGETQHIIINASNGNDGSKVNPTVSGAVLNLSWESTDEITVSGGATGTLTHKSGTGATATFEGDITKTSEAGLVFSTGVATVNYENQTGTLEGLKGNIRLEGTSDYKPAGDYGTINMELTYAILKLDLSALGTAEGDNTVAITGAGESVSVSNVTNAPDNPYFVAMPTNNTSTTYTFSCSGKTGKATWTLAANTFYTKTDGNGGSTGEAIVIAPTPKFSVSATRTVEFSRGNLWADATDPANPVFHLEANQWGYTVGEYYSEDEYHDWVQSHVSHFYWSKDARVGCATDYKVANKEYGITPAEDDEFFANTSLSVEGQTGWRTLSRDEWEYLLRDRTPTTTSANFKSLTIGGTSNTVSGLVILPDNSTVALNDITNTDDLAAAGAVFLPAAGYRYGTSVYSVGSGGYYWSSTPYEGNKEVAYVIYFYSGDVHAGGSSRDYGLCVRLVR